jgi:hypothetical protein
MPDVETVQASAPQVMKRDLTIRVGTMRNHNYHSSKTAEMPYKSYLCSWVSSRQWDKCTVRMSDRADSRQAAINPGDAIAIDWFLTATVQKRFEPFQMSFR